MPNNWAQTRRNNVGNLMTDKKREFCLGSSNNLALPKILKFPCLTTVQTLNHWANNKLIVFMNQYWWGNIKKAAKSTYLARPLGPKYNPGKEIHTSPGHLNCPMNPLRFGKWISCNFLISWK